MKIYALVACGPNNLHIPCLLFASKDRADTVLAEILGSPSFARPDGTPVWDVEWTQGEPATDSDESPEPTATVWEAEYRAAYTAEHKRYIAEANATDRRSHEHNLVYEKHNLVYEKHKDAVAGLKQKFAGRMTRPIDWHRILTSYYGGCGEIGQFEFQEIEEGAPFIRWDLD